MHMFEIFCPLIFFLFSGEIFLVYWNSFIPFQSISKVLLAAVTSKTYLNFDHHGLQKLLKLCMSIKLFGDQNNLEKKK